MGVLDKLKRNKSRRQAAINVPNVSADIAAKNEEKKKEELRTQSAYQPEMFRDAGNENARANANELPTMADSNSANRVQSQQDQTEAPTAQSAFQNRQAPTAAYNSDINNMSRETAAKAVASNGGDVAPETIGNAGLSVSNMNRGYDNSEVGNQNAQPSQYVNSTANADSAPISSPHSGIQSPTIGDLGDVNAAIRGNAEKNIAV